MLNFAVGPVQMEEKILALGAEQIPYFRTAEFSQMMKENEAMINQCMGAQNGSRVLFLTGSGTAAMEAVVWNIFTSKDKVLVVNGGTFGGRFVKLCQFHHIPYMEIRLQAGRTLRKRDLDPYEGQGITGFLVNMLETSTGVSYDMDLIGAFCKRNQCLFVCDAVSSFLVDPLSMTEMGIDVVLTGSQKGLCLPPGISVITLNERAVGRVEANEISCMYLNLKDYLNDGRRGQTPYTPAVSVLIQMYERLKEIIDHGLSEELRRPAELAADFRWAIRGMPLEIASDRLSNAVTPLHPLRASAYQIFLTLKDDYGIFVCPNGGAMAETLFRVGHMGCLTKEDNQKLVGALKDMQNRGLL